MQTNDKVNELLKRNLISNIVHKEYFYELINGDQCKFYIGIDPTNDKYHIGHLVPYIMALRLLKLGAKGVILVGGFTGKVGDPSFRNTERPLMDSNIVNNNTKIMLHKLEYLFRHYTKQITFVNNEEWLNTMSLSEFLDYSTHISANKLLKMDHIKSRLEEELPLSFKEVCYTLLQAIDFQVLHRNHKINLQLGGNDQWINILNGVHLIEKMNNATVVGITLNLLLTKDGKKMGKTEHGAIWADGSLPIFEFWQYWRNMSDADLQNIFYTFSFRSIEEIDEILNLNNTINPDEKINQAKAIFANEITTLVYGEGSEEKILNILNNNDKPIKIPQDIKNIINLLVILKFVDNKSEAKRQIIAGAVRINNEKITENILLVTLNKNFVITLGKSKKAQIVI